jgi:dTDP-4-dehydrorhamnose reductase
VKVFLTGASGLVGSAVAVAAARIGHSVTGVVGRFPGEIAGLSQRITLDLADGAAVTRTVLHEAPDAIVNCAAISEPASCDANPALSNALNVALPIALASAAEQLGARFLHISSEQVFDGQQTSPYGILDPTRPINLYGRQKVESERAVLGETSCAIVRAPLLMGMSPGGRRALHERLFADWAAGKTARLYSDEFRQPCTADNLANVLVELIDRPNDSGIFHWAGVELVSRYELGCRLRAHFNLSETAAPIQSIKRSDTPEISVQRQPCLALNLSPLAERLKTRPQSLAEQFASLTIPGLHQAWYAQQRR